MKAAILTAIISVIALLSTPAFAIICSDTAPVGPNHIIVPCEPLIKPKLKIKRPRPARLITVTVYPGSLKYNIIQIANNYGWNTVVWNYPADFNWVGQTQISADTLQNVFIKLLSNYPLQAQFYDGNHVIAIVPRNLS